MNDSNEVVENNAEYQWLQKLEYNFQQNKSVGPIITISKHINRQQPRRNLKVKTGCANGKCVISGGFANVPKIGKRKVRFTKKGRRYVLYKEKRKYIE